MSTLRRCEEILLNRLPRSLPVTQNVSCFRLLLPLCSISNSFRTFVRRGGASVSFFEHLQLTAHLSETFLSVINGFVLRVSVKTIYKGNCGLFRNPLNRVISFSPPPILPLRISLERTRTFQFITSVLFCNYVRWYSRLANT